MRLSLIFTAGLLVLSAAASAKFVENRNLTLPAENLRKLVIESGAGSLEVKGVDNLSTIEVSATIILDHFSPAEARRYLERNMKLELKARGSSAYLTGLFEEQGISFGSLFHDKSAQIDLVVKIPKKLALEIDDGSGDISVADIDARVEIEDGSGDLTVGGISGNLDINDGSGDIAIHGVGGNIEIDDGSGMVDIEDIGGDVNVDDGSGDIGITSVEGSVTIDDGSGDIRIDKVREDVNIASDGSGGTYFSHIDGRVYGDVDHYYRKRR